ncbi:MAG: NAD-dependent dihydropyrimidine dehydrogenase subunit PreA [Candidatus Tritonobacter lacicola]|nr:NAD-dependent dihydropyrimidine dehydrogenase subunit PreA [Candidatus Tritonobacter lacicola]
MKADQYPNLAVEFCGLKFMNPFMLSSSPVSNTAEMVGRAFEAGWAGVAYKTLGPECLKIVNVTPRLNVLNYEDKRFLGLQNLELITDRPLKDNLKDISTLKKEYPRHIVFSSIMAEGSDKKGWQDLTKMSEDAGADGIELNFSCPHGMPEMGAGAAIGQNPDVVTQITEWVKKVSTTPVMVKMTPNITDMCVPARAAQKGGADALAAINTFRAISAINLETFEPLPTVEGQSASGGFSGPAMKPIALRYIYDMASDPQIKIPISGMGGITTWEDAAEFVLVGATTLQATTSIMRYGNRIIEDLLEGLSDYLKRKKIKSLMDMVGKSLDKFSTVESLPRKPVMVSSVNDDLCIRCGLCYITCADGGHSAISMGRNRKIEIDEDECAGCGLCVHVCPVWGCITMTKKKDK